MSGIAVIHDASRAAVPEEDLLALLKEIESRGTEHFTWFAPGIAIGQRLLATTPEALYEHLPLTVSAARFQVVLDGRLDNRDDLLRSLAPSQPATSPLSDQDLVALACERWGENCPAHFIGDFAFVAWDRLEQCLLGARDQRGFRPLVYARAGHRLLIGSDPAQLVRGANLSSEIDQAYLARCLIGIPPQPGASPYAAVRELPSGHSLKVSSNEIHVRPYWEFSSRPQLNYKTQEQYAEHFAAIFSKAVSAATRTIGPPGLLLSGGIDSSCVAAEAVKAAPNLQAFVAYVDDRLGMDERSFAGPIASDLGITLHEFDVNDCWSLSSAYLSPADFDQPEHPMQSALMVKSARVAAAGNVDVLIDGVGGDEFFTGTYGLANLVASGHLLEARRRILQRRQPVRTAFEEEILHPLLPHWIKLLSRRVRGKPNQPALPAWIDANLLPQEVADAQQAASSHASAWKSQSLRQEIWQLMQCVTLPHLSWRARRAYMPQGIEQRSPLWDLRVIEFFLRTPIWVHENAGRGKAILRAHMQDHVPARVHQRDDKALFDGLLRHAITHAEASRVEGALFGGPLLDVPYIKQEELAKELQHYRRKDHPWWLPLWRAITAGLWLQHQATQTSDKPIEIGASQ